MQQGKSKNTEPAHHESEINFRTGLRAGDEYVFRALFKSYYQPLVKHARRYVHDNQTSEDIVCDVFLKLWEEHAHLDIKISIKAYLYQMVRNRSLNYLKAKKPEPADDLCLNLFPSNLATDEQANLTDITNHIQKAIAELPERSRSVFIMHRYDNLKYSEIAEILNITEGTVETHMVRALKFLRKRLAFLLSILLFFGKI